MKKQFNKFFLFNIGISASLLFVFGCGGDVDPVAPLPTDDCIDYIEVRPTFVEPQWLSDIRELYESRSAEHDDYLYAYSPDIPGEFEYRIWYDSKTNSTADSLSLIYYAPNGSYIHLNISPEYELLDINESLSCGGEDVDCDLHSSFTETGELVELIADGNFPEDDERVNVYSSDDKQLISDNCETFGQDSFILYTRVLNLANYAFSDIGVTVEDMGISWGEKYKETSPASPLNSETVEENDTDIVDKEQTENTEKDNIKDNKNGKTSSGKTATIDILDSPQSQAGNSSNTGSSGSGSSEGQNNQSGSDSGQAASNQTTGNSEQSASNQTSSNSGQTSSNQAPANPTVNNDNTSAPASSDVQYSQGDDNMEGEDGNSDIKKNPDDDYYYDDDNGIIANFE